MLRKIGWWLLGAFVVYWVVKDPISASNLATGVGHWFTNAANSVSQFASNLGNKAGG